MAGTDFSHLTSDELIKGIQSLNIPGYIRSKSYGVDVRETLAQMTEMLMQLALNQGMSPQEAQDFMARFNNKITKGEVTMSDLTQEVKEALTGGAVAVVGENAVGTVNYQNNSLTYQKTNFPKGYLPLKTTYTKGTVANSGVGNRVRSTPFSLKKGDRITAPSNVRFTLRYATGDSLSGYAGWLEKAKMDRDEVGVVIEAKFSDDKQISDTEVSTFSNLIEIVNEETAYKRKEISKYIPVVVEGFERGGINNAGEADANTSTSKIRVMNLALNAGDILRLEDSDWSMALYSEANGAGYVDNWNTTEYIAPKDTKVSFMLSKGSGRNDEIGTADGVGKVFVYNRNTLVTLDFLSGNQRSSIKYVSNNGSDENTGESDAHPYATLQKALDEGASTIYIERNYYYNQSVVAPKNLGSVTILPYGNKADKIYFLGGHRISDFEAYEGVYRKQFSGVNYTEVFVDKTLSPLNSNSRPSPNAVLWESSGLVDDYMMNPVLSLSELKENKGSLYYDGTYTYINPNNIDNEFWLPETDGGLDFSGIQKLEVTDLAVDYYLGRAIQVRDINDLDLESVHAHHSTTSNGFMLDNSSGDLKNCKARKNRNDGFNIHFTGNINLYNCEGDDNGDDGASPHEDAKITIYGGSYSRNEKGGFSPAYGAGGYVYNAVLSDNRYGIYNKEASEGNISSGNLIKGNRWAYLNTDPKFLSIGDKVVGNSNDLEGTAFESY